MTLRHHSTEQPNDEQKLDTSSVDITESAAYVPTVPDLPLDESAALDVKGGACAAGQHIKGGQF
ncbi:MAG: hypothetical protein ACYDHH_31600 [Solirubrobacteraceae bacterium]